MKRVVEFNMSVQREIEDDNENSTDVLNSLNVEIMKLVKKHGMIISGISLGVKQEVIVTPTEEQIGFSPK